jgi:predicted RNA-binding protein YlqC (UPF0109 family)
MSEAIKTATDFVKYTLEQICEHSDSIVVEHKVDDLGVLISVTVAEADMGKLIGKSGQTISALRTLVRIIGARDNERINLKVLEPAE